MRTFQGSETVNAIRRTKRITDDMFERVFGLFLNRQEPYWLVLLSILAMPYLNSMLPEVGSGTLDGIRTLYQGALIPMLSLLVIFLAWPGVKPGAQKWSVNDRYTVLVAAIIMVGSWYALGESVLMILIVCLSVLGVLFTGAFGLNRLLVAPFFFGAASPVLMGYAGVQTNMLAVSIDQLLAVLGVPTRGWREMLAVMSLVVVTSSVILLLVSLRGSSVFGKRVEQSERTIEDLDFQTKPNFIRLGCSMGWDVGTRLMFWFFRNFRSFSVWVFNKGRASVKESIQNKKMARLQRRTAAELAAAAAAAAQAQQEEAMADVVFGDLVDNGSGEDMFDGRDSFIDLPAADVEDIPRDSSVVSGQVVYTP